MRARRAAALLLLALAAAAAALLLLREGGDDSAERPPPPGPVRASAPGVAVEARSGAVRVENDGGTWTVLAECRGDEERTVGPGYVSRLVAPDGTVVVDDEGPPQPLNDPGYGGLGAFAWHHARGRPGALRLGRESAWEVSGRVCASAAGGFGVSTARLLEPPRAAGGAVAFAVEVELSDEWTYPEPLMRVRYRYRAEREALHAEIAVTELCPEGRCGRTARRAFVKEPKLAAAVRGGEPLPFSRVATFGGGELRCVYVGGGPARGPVLDTGQCGHPERERVRLDAGTATSGTDGACERVLCLHVTMRGAGGVPWSGSRGGFDAWARDASSRAPALDRDTGSIDGVLWGCHGGSPGGEGVRRWETIARLGADGRHRALGVLFTAWQGGRGGYDCEPLARLFGAAGATWEATAEYRLGGEG